MEIKIAKYAVLIYRIAKPAILGGPVSLAILVIMNNMEVATSIRQPALYLIVRHARAQVHAVNARQINTT